MTNNFVALDFSCLLEHCTNESNPKTGGWCSSHGSMKTKYGTPTPQMECPEPTCQKLFVYLGNSRPNHKMWCGAGKRPYCDDCCNLFAQYGFVGQNRLAKVSQIFYIKMYIAQGFTCKICKEKTKLVVDHDHSCCEFGCTDCVRALLCHRCNIMVGHFESNHHLLNQVEAYVLSYGELQ